MTLYAKKKHSEINYRCYDCTLNCEMKGGTIKAIKEKRNRKEKEQKRKKEKERKRKK